MAETENLRALPKVDAVLRVDAVDAVARRLPHALVVRVVQEEVARIRDGIRRGAGIAAGRDTALAAVAARTRARLEALARPSLRRVINATGVVLHTNLGRARLSEAAIAAVVEVARHPTNLEFDLERGERSSRMDHVEALLAGLCGAEAALVVNNNAAAVLLAVEALGSAGVVISRGELIEIGDSFRLPEILARARVPIHEIGTTNRTTPEDYAAAAAPGCMLLKVHRSNFTQRGFTREASVAELAAVARRCGALVAYDLGAGSLVSFAEHGLAGEPDLAAALADGADLVTMSGDKLLGGPQAGLVAGRHDPVRAMRRNPLARALRIDKLTLAAVQATLLSYLAGDSARHEVPTLRLILTKPEDIEARARRLMARLERRVPADLEVAPAIASVGGGAFADAELPSFEMRLRPRAARSTEVLALLRGGEPAVVARIKDDTLGFDLRAVNDDDVELLAQAIEAALRCGGGEGT